MKRTATQDADTRIVCGATCTWWGTIHQVAKRPNSGLPCCPICGGMLFETENQEEWDANVRSYADSADDPDYPEYITWLRGRCIPNHEKARRMFDEMKGVNEAVKSAIGSPLEIWAKSMKGNRMGRGIQFVACKLYKGHAVKVQVEGEIGYLWYDDDWICTGELLTLDDVGRLKGAGFAHFPEGLKG